MVRPLRVKQPQNKYVGKVTIVTVIRPFSLCMRGEILDMCKRNILNSSRVVLLVLDAANWLTRRQ